MPPGVVVSGILILTFTAIAIALQGPPASGVVLKDPPQTVMATTPFDVGDTYTVGGIGVGPASSSRPEVRGPITITAVELLNYANVEILGVGAFDPEANPSGIGLVPGWPPEGREPYVDPVTSGKAWPRYVSVVVGIRTTAAKSGLRGIQVSWIDGGGNRGSRVFDIAVLTCAPGACEVDAGDAEPLLRELGLQL